MPEEVQIIRFELDSQQAEQNAQALTGAIIDLKDQVSNTTKEIKSLEKQNADLNKNVKAGTVTQEEANKAAEQNNKRIKELKVSQAGLRDQITDLNKKRREEVQIAKIQDGSLNALRKQTQLLTKERNNLNRNTVEGSKRFKELTKEINENNKQIREADQAAGNFGTSVGNYQEAVSGAIAQTGLFSGTLGRAIQFTKGIQAAIIATSQSLGVFKTALLSTGVGAIVIALGSLITFLTKTQRGIDQVNKVLAFLGAFFDEIVDNISAFGETLIEAISEPQKLFESFVSFLETQLVNRINGLIDIFAGLGTVISGVFSLSFEEIEEGLKTSGDGLVKFTTGFKTEDIVNGFNDVTEAIKEVGETAFEEANRALQLEEQFQRLEERQIGFISERAKAEKEIAELRLSAEDLGLSDEERIAALRQAVELTRQLSQEESILAQQELRIAEERIALGESTREDIREVEELRARVFELQRKRLLEERRLRNELNSEEQRFFNDRVKRIEELNKLEEEDFEKFLEQNEEFLEAIDEQIIKEIELEQQKNDALKELREKNTEQAINEAQNLGNQLIGLVNSSLDAQTRSTQDSFKKREKALREQLEAGLITQQQFDQKSVELTKQRENQLFEIELAKFKAERVAALSNIAIDTAQAVQKSIAASPLTFGLPWSAFAVAQGALQTAAVLSQPEPTRPSFAEGGDVKAYLLGGKRHSLGGTKFHGDDGTSFEAEKGEGIFVTKRSATSEALSYINQKYGGRSFDQPGRYLQEGGSVVTNTGNFDQIQGIVVETVDSVLKNVNFVVTVEDIQNGISERDNVINQGTVI